MDIAKLQALMEENPRLPSRRYAEMAAEEGLANDIDGDELRLQEIQKYVRRIARNSKADPQLAIVSFISPNRDGEPEEVYAPAKVCTKIEAQRVLDDYGSRIEGSIKRATQLLDYWNAKPFGYQLTFSWG